MSPITVRPLYDSRHRSLRGYVWGIYDGEFLTAIVYRYPSRLTRELRA